AHNVWPVACTNSGSDGAPVRYSSAEAALPSSIGQCSARLRAPPVGRRQEAVMSGWQDWLTDSFFRIRVAPAAAQKLRALSQDLQDRLRQMLHDIAELA